MANDLNQCTFTGRLGADPEIRSTQAGKSIANFRMAVGEQWKTQSGEKQESTEWVSVVCFSDGLTGVIEKYLRKGSRVLVQGKQKTRKWQDNNGNDRYSTEIILNGPNSILTMLDERPRQNQDRPGEFGDHRSGSSQQVVDDLDVRPSGLGCRLNGCLHLLGWRRPGQSEGAALDGVAEIRDIGRGF